MLACGRQVDPFISRSGEQSGSPIGCKCRLLNSRLKKPQSTEEIRVGLRL
jgi:hypothetical protein